MTPTRAPRRAGTYARTSPDPNGTALGVARQQQDAAALAEAKGWQVIDTGVDSDGSASSEPRPQHLRMLADVESGNVVYL